MSEELPPLPPEDQSNLPRLPQGQGLMDILGQHQEFYEKAREENTKQPFEMTSELGPDGKMKYNFGNVDESLVKTIFQDLKWKNDTMAEMQKEVGRIEKQRSSGNAILDVLATVGGELAAGDPRLPPVVSALGRASLRLNPTQQELTDRKVGLMQAMSQMGDQTLRSQEAYQRTQIAAENSAETKRHNIDVEENKQLDKALQAGRLSAQKGGGAMSEEAFGALMDSYGVKDPAKKEKGYLAHLEQAKLVLGGKEEELKGKERIIGKTAEETRETNRLKARENYNTIDYRNASGLVKAKALADYKEAIAQEKPLEIVPARDKKDLIGLRETDRYIDGITEMLDDPQFAQLMGAEKLGRYATRRLTSDQRVKLENYLKHETPRILNLVLRGGQGGASILRTEEGKKMVQSLGVMTDLTVSQAREVIGNIKKVTSDGRKSIMDATPRAPWDQYPDLIGDDEGYRPRVVGRGQTGPNATNTPSAAAASIPPEVTDRLKGQPPGTIIRSKKTGKGFRMGKNGQVEVVP
jgi:hypothetical protein